jgi:hypothetical protein
MTFQRCFAICCALFVLAAGLLPSSASAEEKKKGNKYACSEPNPASQCNAGNTCGADCQVYVKRTAYSSSATPNISGAKGNQLFCVKAGTTVTWMSSAKNIGFLIDFGPTSPFDPDDPIMGGSKKSVPVKAVKPGCYMYNFSATDSSGIYGMSKAAAAELIVVP